jgi:gluconokinase
MSFRRPLVVMGVSGTGKSTIGRGLAETLGLPFVEGDDLHPHTNVAKMAKGIPLTDADRDPWLDRIAAELDRAVVITCSALKRSYRDRLRTAAPDLVLVYLHGTPELLASRMAQRDGHFMPTSLLASQLATLEEPSADENAIAVDVARRPDEIVDSVIDRLRRRD